MSLKPELCEGEVGCRAAAPAAQTGLAEPAAKSGRDKTIFVAKESSMWL